MCLPFLKDQNPCTVSVVQSLKSVDFYFLPKFTIVYDGRIIPIPNNRS